MHIGSQVSAHGFHHVLVYRFDNAVFGSADDTATSNIIGKSDGGDMDVAGTTPVVCVVNDNIVFVVVGAIGHLCAFLGRIVCFLKHAKVCITLLELIGFNGT